MTEIQLSMNILGQQFFNLPAWRDAPGGKHANGLRLTIPSAILLKLSTLRRGFAQTVNCSHRLFIF